ncbi:hypothetical protein DPMN_132193 [Dreissena polymorpha]|uniref:Uncharacterized protein n=1 Tax=Dreissena polymorpha TaxID=45954 RepID=A0A9D4FVN1_DREPO|nr:hypothetical protein DPMN_132193 [Dreissena polymorpha]
MLYVLILAFLITCVSCGEKNALGLSARTKEDSEPLDHSRRVVHVVGVGAVVGAISVISGGRTMGWWKRGSTDVSLN